jgi:hypothetical protein
MVAFSHWPFRGLPGRPLEAVGLALLIGATTALTFTSDEPLSFLLVPLPIVATFRFRQPGAVGAILITAAIAIPLTEADEGPFGGHAPDDRLVLATALLGVLSVTMLILAAVLTERERAENAVRSVADALQESLQPPRLPAISGVDLAVDFRPVGEHEVVGGDFYDVAEGDDGSYGIVVGDALGKGAIAAADTALARYTLRAAALRERRPSNILRTLNDAMLRQAPDHPCTVVYIRLELAYPGARLLVSLAGHPQPLVLRHDGRVEAIGAAALPLGVTPDLELQDHRADLRPGDALIIYTDGLTDAYAPDRIVAASDLEAALRPFGGAEAGRIVGAARAVALPDRRREPRDDILVLALRLRPVI